MSPPPIIHRRLDQLRPQLLKYEPRKIRRNVGPSLTLVFAINYLEFDPKLPVLKERYLRAKHQRLIHPEQGQPEKDSTYHVEERRLEEKSVEDEEHHDGKPEEKKPVAENGVGEGNLLETEEPAEDTSFVDRLILTGPDEDEFRQYDDDDDDEETVISKNRKKISTEAIIKGVKTSNPLAKPCPPVKPARLMAQSNQIRQPARESPRQDSSGQPAPVPQNASPQQSNQVAAPKEVTIADVNKYLEQKNLLLVQKELEQHKDKLPAEEAKLVLRKAVFACLERDETFMLMKFIKLVFEINYNNDAKFWDELIGKIKRKTNHHAKCLTFRTEVDPKLVLKNYNSIIKQIGEYFERTNPTLTLPWSTFVYIRDLCKQPPPQLPVLESATPISLPTITTQVTPLAQENLDPEKQRHVLEISTGINKKEFRITIPRRQATFSSKLLVKKANPTS